MPYVDGFVVAVPKSKIADYKKLARKHGKVWREHGALAYVECLGDDVPYGKHTSFPRAVKAKDSETSSSPGSSTSLEPTVTLC
jgi:uncharacterized protein YbaA (DUF1428 family)